tara:strand:- start:1017 stop:1331 length:315 start_codon:yes stop_codon:yes gene_type:complete
MIKEIFKDERGTPSAARVFLATTMIFTAFIIIIDSIVWDVPEPAYALLGSLGVGLLAWTAGPRMAAYIGPQVGAVASGIAQAVKGTRRPDLLDNDVRFREHDEK